MKRLLLHIGKIIRGKRPTFAFDFDGTLARIANSPREAAVDGQMQKSLSELEVLARVVILSSRTADSLMQKLPELKRARIIGLHGLEDAGKPGRIGKAGKKAIEKARAAISHLIRQYEGAWIEDKKMGLVVHFRKVARARQGKLEGRARAIMEGFGLRVYLGKKAIEARLFSAPTKAGTIRKMASGLGSREILLYFGDDAADEEAFIAIRRIRQAIGVVVGRRKKSAAAYYAKNVSEVGKIMRKAIKALDA
ncbi:MAG: trehalose-phosphatase [Candidatus Micrarchaeota archaeon]